MYAYIHEIRSLGLAHIDSVCQRDREDLKTKSYLIPLSYKERVLKIEDITAMPGEL